MIVMIDNYDSFVHNLARYLVRLGADVRVIRNDALSLADLQALAPQAIVLSPGPCGPDQAGLCLDIVRDFHTHIPILGVCLGHQVIAQAFGGTVSRSPLPTHGKASLVYHNYCDLFKNLPNPLQVGRYHSLSVTLTGTPLQATAHTDTGEVMALRHPDYPLFGVQFHPESILTEQGDQLLANFLTLSRGETP